MWIDIAAIVFVCTAVNHLGLIAAIERVIRHRLPVVNCPKCLTFWSMMACGVAEENSSLFTLHSSLRLLAISILCAYTAIWLELIMYAIDTLYNKIYGILEDNNEEDDDEDDGSEDEPEVW